MRERQELAHPPGDGEGSARDEAEEHDRQHDEHRQQRRRPRLAGDGAEQRAGRSDRRSRQRHADEEQRQTRPRLAAGHSGRLHHDSEHHRDRGAEDEPDQRGQGDLRAHELSSRDEPAAQPRHRALVALGSRRPGREQQREEGDRQRDPVRLHLRRQHPRASLLLRLGERDRARGRLEGVARLREREAGDPDEAADRGHALALRQPVELPLHPVEAQDPEVAAEEARVPAVQDQVHIAQVRGDVAGLELAVEPVDERLHLLRHARREAAGAGAQDQARAADRRDEVGEEARRDRDRRDDLARRELALCLVGPHPHECHLTRHLVDHRLKVEAVAADHDGARQPVFVDERDTRLGARVAGDETDEQRDHDRIREQRREQERRAQEDAEVLAQQQPDGCQPNTSAAASA